jgi:hypothetical protein
MSSGERVDCFYVGNVENFHVSYESMRTLELASVLRPIGFKGPKWVNLGLSCQDMLRITHVDSGDENSARYCLLQLRTSKWLPTP